MSRTPGYAQSAGADAAELARFDALAHRVLLDHRVDRKVLAHITQKIQQPEVPKPFKVADYQRTTCPRRIKKACHLPLHRRSPLTNRLGCVQAALGRLEARITYESRGTADQRDRSVAAQLEPT